ncbi:hypothetical protein GCM10029978_065470 [Actinoallomurus acanthiterrae]
MPRRLLDLLAAQGEATATTLVERLPVSRRAVVKYLGVLGARAGGGDAVDQNQEPALPRWAGTPIRGMTVGQLGDVVAYLRAATRRDEVLIRAVQTELTFRQAGIHHEPGPAPAPADPHVSTPGG